MEGELVIRETQPRDTPRVAAIFAHYVNDTIATFETTPPTAQAWTSRQRAAREAGLPFLVGTVGGLVVGYAYVTPWRAKPAYRHTLENSIYLAPEYTARSYGRALLGELIVQASAAGARQIIAVIADTGNPASEVLHYESGFVHVGRLTEVGFKHGRWIDTVLMQRTLAS
jgi:L-amino acid N-acyltransferase YncA